jgi:hypothetical protein
MEAIKEKTKSVNGVNTEQLFNTIDLIKENPDIAKFKFRATNKWINGTHCRGTIKDFYGALKEDDSRPSVDYDMDEPPVLLGNNEGRNPVEYLLVPSPAVLQQALSLMHLLKGLKSRVLNPDMRATLIYAAFWDYQRTSRWVIRKFECSSKSMQMFQMNRKKKWYAWVKNTHRFIIPLPSQLRLRFFWINKKCCWKNVDVVTSKLLS